MTLPDVSSIVKYYGQSYVPGDKKRVDELTSPLHVQLLTIRDKEVFITVLSQRRRFASFDVAARFNAQVVEVIFPSYKRPAPLGLDKVTLLHLSLIVRPDLTSIIIDQIPLEKIESVLDGLASIPSKLFSADADNSSEAHDALSLVEKCRQFEKTEHYRFVPELAALYDQAKKAILDAKLVAQIYKVLPEDIQNQLSEQQGTIRDRLNRIVDWLNGENLSAGTSFFKPASTAEVQKTLSALKLQIDPDEKWSVETLKRAVSCLGCQKSTPPLTH